jgi:hypothetical protein
MLHDALLRIALLMCDRRLSGVRPLVLAEKAAASYAAVVTDV